MGDNTRWAPGTAYGPVLSQTDLYLLKPKVELHPILTQNLKSFHLIFNLSSGVTGGFNADERSRDLPFEAGDESATLPRITELYIITRDTPWCTIVKNARGVSMNDVCSQLWKDYTEHYLTEAEFISLPPQYQERIRRAAMTRESGSAGWNGYYQAQQSNVRCKRIDWLRDRVFFDGLERDDHFAVTRLGFAAPNIWVLKLTQ